MPNGLPIDLEQFKDLNTTESKLEAIFKVLVHMNSSGFECEDDRVEKAKDLSKEQRMRFIGCEQRFLKLEARRNFDTTFSGIMGIVGGAVIWVIKWAIGK